MKRILSVMIVSVLLLASCSRENTDVIKTSTDAPAVPGYTYTESSDGILDFGSRSGFGFGYYDGYIYVTANGMLYRINERTGNATSVCADPLCLHDSPECLLYGIKDIFYISAEGDICFAQMYFKRYDDNGTLKYPSQNRFVKLDTQSSRVTVLDDYSGAGGSFHCPEIYYGNQRIYYGQEYDAENNELTCGVRKTDLDTGKSEFWGGEETKDGYITLRDVDLLFRIGERIYFNDGECVFSLDENGGCREVLDNIKIPLNSGATATDGEFLYHSSFIGDGEIVRYSLETGEKEILVDKRYTGQRFIMTKDYIYYSDGEDVVLGKAQIRGYASDTVTLSGGELWRCRHDGSGKELVYTYSGKTENIRPFSQTIIGNYLWADYSWWEDPDGDGVYTDGAQKHSTHNDGNASLLRIDLTSGEALTVDIIK